MPGEIVDLAVDTDLNWVYVLGRGVQYKKGLTDKGMWLDKVSSKDAFYTYYAPSWISLVKYDRTDLTEAAPRHGFGYYDLPQDLVATDIALDKEYLYVTATGYQLDRINTPYEDKNVLLVYDRELRDEVDIPEEGKTRDILYSLPLPIEHTPTKAIIKDKLVFIAAGSDGVVVVNIADPVKPSVVTRLTQGTVAGKAKALFVWDIELVGKQLHVVAGLTASPSTKYRFVFDITKPSLPQLGASNFVNISAPLVNEKAFTTGGNLQLVDSTYPQYLRADGSYNGFGFSIMAPLHPQIVWLAQAYF